MDINRKVTLDDILEPEVVLYLQGFTLRQIKTWRALRIFSTIMIFSIAIVILVLLILLLVRSPSSSSNATSSTGSTFGS